MILTGPLSLEQQNPEQNVKLGQVTATPSSQSINAWS